jgi:hypothetical protein
LRNFGILSVEYGMVELSLEPQQVLLAGIGSRKLPHTKGNVFSSLHGRPVRRHRRQNRQPGTDGSYSGDGGAYGDGHSSTYRRNHDLTYWK